MLTMSIDRTRLSRRAKLITGSVAVCLLLPLAALRMPAQGQAGQSAGAPRGWYLAGSNPANYETGVDPQAIYNNSPSAYLRSKQPAVEGFGTLMQDFRADKYAGKRVRFSAFARTEAVQEWAGLWMRIDKGPEMLGFDNMQDRPLKGTKGWQNYQIVLDVPQDATGVFFGVLLSGTGTVWINSVKFEIVGTDVPTTSKPLQPVREGPTNLNFEN